MPARQVYPVWANRAVRLTTKAEPRCAIVIGRDRLEPDVQAASVITKTIATLTGLSVGISDSLSDPKVQVWILVGWPALANFTRRHLPAVYAELQKSLEKLRKTKNGDQGFVIRYLKHKGRDIIALAGYTDQGTFYAAQTFCNRLYFNNREDLVIDRENAVTAPAFRYRSLAGSLGGPDMLGSREFERDFGRKDGTLDYRAFIDWMVGLKMNNLNLWMLDFMWGLTYPSAKYPEAVNLHHPNVRHEFLGDLLRYAKKNYIDVWIQVNLPDNWTGIIKAYPQLAAPGVDFKAIPRGGEWDSFLKGDMAYAEYNGLRTVASSVAADRPAVFDFWNGFWEELLERYPDIAGVGGQFGEHVDDAQSLSLEFKYFKRMAELAVKRNPRMHTWFYQAAGSVEILAKRNQLPNVAYIGWHRPITRNFDWFLSHGGAGLWWESEFKKDALVASDLGLSGIQKRLVSFYRQEKVYYAVGELAWNPALSFQKLAHYSTIRMLRRKERAVRQAYAAALKIISGRRLPARAIRRTLMNLKAGDKDAIFSRQVTDCIAANVPAKLPRCILRAEDQKDKEGLRILTVRPGRGFAYRAGMLDRKKWRKVRFSAGFVKPDNAAAVAEVGVAAVDDDRQLIFCFACADNDTARLKCAVERKIGLISGKDEWMGQDDMLAIFIQPDETKSVYYQLIFNAKGIQLNQKKDLARNLTDYSYDAGMKIATATFAGYWLAEVALPYKGLGVDKRDATSWRVNFHRLYRDRLAQTASWSFTGESFHQPERFGRLVFQQKGVFS